MAGVSVLAFIATAVLIRSSQMAQVEGAATHG
jgi:hypothetical protein